MLRSRILFVVALLCSGTAGAQTYYAREKIAAKPKVAAAPVVAKKMTCGSLAAAMQADARASGAGVAASITSPSQALDWCQNKSKLTVNGICTYDSVNEYALFYTGADLVPSSRSWVSSTYCTYG